MRAAAPDLAELDVVILAGGLGTRVAPLLGPLPKIMAPAGGRPLLDHLLAWLAAQGARRVVLCLGHRAQPVLAHLAASSHRLEIVPLVEPEPLGTAGAIAFARAALRSDPVLVMNGDTLLELDLAGFLVAFRQAALPAAMACVAVDDAARYGRVEIDAAGRVARLDEKDATSHAPGWINAGLYLFGRRQLDLIAAVGQGSLEHDILARLPPGSIHAFRSAGRFLDIGTPETLGLAGAFLGGGAAAARRA